MTYEEKLMEAMRVHTAKIIRTGPEGCRKYIASFEIELYESEQPAPPSVQGTPEPSFPSERQIMERRMLAQKFVNEQKGLTESGMLLAVQMFEEGHRQASGQDRWNDESVKRFAADLIWETYGKKDCILVTEEYFKTYPFKPTPESRWPTEEEMSLEATRHCNDNSFQEQYRVWHEAIQWVKEWLQTSAGTRETELEKCLGEALKVMLDLKEDFRYVTWGEDETHFENTDNWRVLCGAITRAKSLINPDK